MSTLAKLRAKRARELQTELQALAQFRRSSRAHVAAIARAWKPLSKRLTRAFSRMNAVLPDELQLDGEVETPGAQLSELTEALRPSWELADTIKALRKLGPKLAKIKPAKVRKATAKQAAERKSLLKVAPHYETIAAALVDETLFLNRLHNANAVAKMDGKRPYTEDSYRVQLAKWLADYDAKRRAVGLPGVT